MKIEGLFRVLTTGKLWGAREGGGGRFVNTIELCIGITHLYTRQVLISHQAHQSNSRPMANRQLH